jgi:hypothetical protein
VAVASEERGLLIDNAGENLAAVLDDVSDLAAALFRFGLTAGMSISMLAV